jgi:transcription elongation factor GreA
MAKAKSTTSSQDDQEVLVLTRDGLKTLEEELQQLKTAGRKQVAERLKEAISYGDLSENSEYEEAKNYQAFVEGRIMELEYMVKNAKVVDENDHSKQVVEIGTKVKVKNLTTGDSFEVTIVGVTEADPFNSRMSSESPLGLALMGARIGDKASASTPNGTMELEVLGLS